MISIEDVIRRLDLFVIRRLDRRISSCTAMASGSGTALASAGAEYCNIFEIIGKKI